MGLSNWSKNQIFKDQAHSANCCRKDERIEAAKIQPILHKKGKFSLFGLNLDGIVVRTG